MRTIPTEFYPVLERLLDSGVLAWAVTIELSDASGLAIYLTSNNRAIDRNGNTHLPYPLRIGEIEDSGNGDLPTTQLTLSNVGRFPMPYLEGRQFDQARVIMELVYISDVSKDILRVDATALAATATSEAVSITLGPPSHFDEQFPGLRWIRSERFPGIPRNVH